jgi:hypothetical protein
MTIRGSVDLVTTQEAHGWAYPEAGRDVLTVQAMLNNEVIGEGAAENHRSDLASAGLGSGNFGFGLRYYRELNPLYLPFVVFKIEGGDVELPRSSPAGFLEFFTAFYRQNPAGGRHRSLMGGLWTDRVDAAALLSGKVRVGHISETAAAHIGALVEDGLAIFSDVLPSATKGRGAPTLERTPASIIDADPVLEVLTAVLEDEPLVFRAEFGGDGSDEIVQASGISDLPSPNECVCVIAAGGDEPIDLDVIRGSHTMPEFTAGGTSRWMRGCNNAGIEVAIRQYGMLDRHVLQPGSLAIIGPGTLFKVASGGAPGMVKLLCSPARINPVGLDGDTIVQQSMAKQGARFWLKLPA